MLFIALVDVARFGTIFCNCWVIVERFIVARITDRNLLFSGAALRLSSGQDAEVGFFETFVDRIRIRRTVCKE